MVLSYHYTGFEAGDEDQSSLEYLSEPYGISPIALGEKIS
jgi:hypothetical protein